MLNMFPKISILYQDPPCSERLRKKSTYTPNSRSGDVLHVREVGNMLRILEVGNIDQSSQKWMTLAKLRGEVSGRCGGEEVCDIGGRCG